SEEQSGSSGNAEPRLTEPRDSQQTLKSAHWLRLLCTNSRQEPLDPPGVSSAPTCKDTS
ncbi:Hypothetical predicted protein, partial [Marmota monax]